MERTAPAEYNGLVGAGLSCAKAKKGVSSIGIRTFTGQKGVLLRCAQLLRQQKQAARHEENALPRSQAPLCQVHDKKIFIFSCPHNPAFLIGILPPPVSVRRQKTHEVAPFLPAAYTQKLCRLFCNKTQSA
jgi:hypothetical protein